MESFEQPVLKSISEFLGPSSGGSLYMDKFSPKNLPVWIKDFAQFYRVDIDSRTTLIIAKPHEGADVEKIINLYRVLRNLKNENVLILADTLSSKAKLDLLKGRIPHITSTGSIFAPELGIIYRDVLAKSERDFEQREKLLPLAQKLVSAYLINPKFFEGKDSLGDLIKYLDEDGYKKSISSLSRAFHQLESLQIIRFEGQGPNKHSIFLDRDIVWSRLLELGAETEMTKIREFYLPDNKKFPWVYAGDSALARMSDLIQPKNEVIAMSSSDYKKWKMLADQYKGEPRGDFGGRPGVTIEVWRDDVLFLSKENCMNPIELALSLRRSREPRTQLAITDIVNKLGLNANLLWEHR